MALYLDYSATTPVHPEVLEAMWVTYTTNFGNAGSRTHVFGQRASQALEHARLQVASLLGVDKSEVVFTSGATESNNLALFGLVNEAEKTGRRHIVSTMIEHNSVLEPLEVLSSRGFEVELVSPKEHGRVNAQDVLSRVREDTLVVSVMHANNETGVIQPVHEIGDALSGTPVYFHIDAAQTYGKLVEELRLLKYDLLSVSGHKVYAPQGVGALIARRRGFRRMPLTPLVYGGGQEDGLRSGTVPVALAVGLGKASELAGTHFKEWVRDMTAVKKSVVDALAAVPHVRNGSEPTLPNCINVSFQGVDSEALMLLVKDSIALSNGSACTSANYEPSHVLTAMGLAPGRIEQAVRISWGPNDANLNLDPLIESVRNLR